MPREREFEIKIICRFCGNEWMDKWFDDNQGKPKYWNMCQNCNAPESRGAKVCYAGAVRNLSAAVYADGFLTRGEIYEIARVKQWQHGQYYYLKGFENCSFDGMLFTKANYQKHTEIARAYFAVPKEFSVVHPDKEVLEGDLYWNTIEQKFLPYTANIFGDLAKNFTLVLRPKEK